MSKPISDYFGSKTTDFEVIEPSKDGVDSYCGSRGGHGSELLEVTREQVEALLVGKAWAFAVNDGEYHHYVVMK